MRMNQDNDTKSVKLQKKERFWDNLTMILSISYAIFLLITGIGYYAADLFMTNAFEHHYSEYYNIFLSVTGICFLSWFVIDLNLFIKMINKLTDRHSGLKLVEGEDGEFHIEIPVEETSDKTIPEYYGFANGRHSGSFFLKIGAGIFCFGHLTHMGLGLTR